ncbi:MAG TPA: proton-conducting transporter membrane subunit, partial [Ignavibacteria bacterium]
MNFTSFLPEISLLMCLTLISFNNFFINESKLKFRVLNFISLFGIIVIFLLLLQQFYYTSDFFFSGTAVFDSYGGLLKILALLSFVFVKFFIGDAYLVENEKEVLISFVCLFGVFIAVSSNNLLLTFTGFELLNLVYFGYLKKYCSNEPQKTAAFFYRSWLISSSLMFFGISIFYGLCGTLNYDLISSFISSNPVNKLTFTIAILLVFSGFAFKLFIFPLQSLMLNFYEKLKIDKATIILVTSIIAASGALTRFVYSAFYERNAFALNGSTHSLTPIFNWELFFLIIFCLTALSSALVLYLQQDFIKILIYIIFVNSPLVLL